MEPDILLKEATELKRNGNVPEAIVKLKQAYKLMDSSSIQYSIDPYLRLPMYLQEINNNDEAWKEFNLLIQKLPHIYGTSKEILVMGYSQIYDKMRLFLQREDKNIEAIKFGILSYLYWGIGLKLQKRKDEYINYTQTDIYKDVLIKLLKKAKKEYLLDKSITLVKTQIDKMPKIDIKEIDAEFQNIFFV